MFISDNMIGIFIIFLILNIILNLNDVMCCVYDALYIWFFNIYPSVFIFYNICSYLTINSFFSRLALIFRILIKFDSNKAYTIFFTSILLGNPGTASLINNAHNNKEISYNDFIKLCDCTFFVNPLFIISFTNIYFYIVYLFCCFIYIKIYSLLFKTNTSNDNFKIKNDKYTIKSLFDSINTSISILLNVSGLVTFFNIFKNTLIFILDIFHINIHYFSFLFSFLEIASGLNFIKSYNNSLLFILLISSQGLCILFQSYSVLDKKNISFKRYILSHLLSTFCVSFIFFILKLFFHI